MTHAVNYNHLTSGTLGFYMYLGMKQMTTVMRARLTLAEEGGPWAVAIRDHVEVGAGLVSPIPEYWMDMRLM